MEVLIREGLLLWVSGGKLTKTVRERNRREGRAQGELKASEGRAQGEREAGEGRAQGEREASEGRARGEREAFSEERLAGELLARDV